MKRARVQPESGLAQTDLGYFGLDLASDGLRRPGLGHAQGDVAWVRRPGVVDHQSCRNGCWPKGKMRRKKRGKEEKKRKKERRERMSREKIDRKKEEREKTKIQGVFRVLKS